MKRLRLTLETIRHLGPGQLRSRLFRMIRRRTDVWLKRPVSASFLPKTADDLKGVWVRWSDDQDTVQSSGEALAAGRFEFLGTSVTYSDQIKWDDPDVSHLWRYHLHYFEYLSLIHI